jgi:7-cyano-7-deazaguanine synthase
MDDNALVMLSGGLDSATCLYWAKEKFSKVSAITFNYFGRLENEKRAAAILAQRADVKELIEIDLPFMKEASDFYNGHFSKPDSDALWSSYVPARNMIFYSIAAHYAEYLGIKWIVGGHNLHDVKFFKDASRGYIEKINSLFQEGCLMCDDRPYQIVLPLAEMDRKEVIRLAIKLELPVELTWSCHREGDMHCRQCYACKQRLDAFGSLGLQDPVFPKA